MFINIITPCSRPYNLHKISESINIPKENYRWIVVFDLEELPKKELIPINCETYLHKNKYSNYGHSQRNYALDEITDGHVYFNDDDTIIHKHLWDNIKDLNNDFISFMQENKNGQIKLIGDNISLNFVDSHNFIVHNSIIGNTIFDIRHYNSDGYFAVECYNKSKNKKYIDKVLSTYNSLK